MNILNKQSWTADKGVVFWLGCWAASWQLLTVNTQCRILHNILYLDKSFAAAKEMECGHEIWNASSLCISLSLKTATGELNLASVPMQAVRGN
jgi:hypothetical protein